MANKKKAKAAAAATGLDKVTDYRFPEATRKNNPPAKIAAEGYVPLVPKAEYTYSPRRPPELRFDPTGRTDEFPELLAKATREPLNEAEAYALAEALRVHEPWLEWAGKREAKSFTVDPVALHIHERVSAQAILRVAARQDVMRSLFADPEQEYNEAVQFYRHDVDWSNRLILGDSLQVMSSLARREDLAGKVQMIYIDPPYGIKFKSNFQPEVGNREVKDRETDLTREPEVVKAYRDTWALGIHSYLAYLRDRLIVARDLLADSGSIFVQIGDENIHHVRELLDEVFGARNFLSMITIQKTTSASDQVVSVVADYLLWYSRDIERVKARSLYLTRSGAGWVNYDYGWTDDGSFRRLTPKERSDWSTIPEGVRVYRRDNLTSQRPAQGGDVTLFSFEGKDYRPGKGTFKTDFAGLERLRQSGRLEAYGATLAYRRFASDFPYRPISNLWTDTLTGGFAEERYYVVQTITKVLQRCILMTTDAGDLILDPTCGSGTTAYVAEQWGRRWITIDTSRVAIAIARQRLLTAQYEFFKLRDEHSGVASGFKCETVPHIALGSIAQNANLDQIFAKHEPILEARLAAANTALAKVPDRLRNDLRTKLALKQKHEGNKAITDADRRRLELPSKGKSWQHWEVPFDTDPDYPPDLKKAVEEYRAAWRAKMDEVNACIAANAEQEELVDQPEVDRKITRVSGPFTVEAVQPPEMSLGDAIEVSTGQFAGEPEALGETFAIREVQMGETPQNIEAYLTKLVELLRMDGVRFPDNKQKKFSRLDPLFASGRSGGIHAEGRWTNDGEADEDSNGHATVGVVFGPQYGPITAKMVEEVIRPAARRYEDLVFAGFSFDGAAQAAIDEGHPRLRIHIAHIRPDVNPGMNGLLKEQPGSQLFTVFGRPRTKLNGPDTDGMYTVDMEGVDIYDPVANQIVDTGATKVAAWFVDSDYDGRTFCITQAFFPDKGAWEKLSKALDGVVDPERFEALSGTKSLPFAAGNHKCVAVKVIDPRGNEVMRVHTLDEDGR
jgi:adenine-specific DNA-methyltransferase